MYSGWGSPLPPANECGAYAAGVGAADVDANPARLCIGGHRDAGATTKDRTARQADAQRSLSGMLMVRWPLPEGEAVVLMDGRDGDAHGQQEGQD